MPLLVTSLVLLLAAVSPARAHDPGLSTGQIRTLPDRIEATLTFARADLESVIPIDTDGDGLLSVTELDTAKTALTALARHALTLQVDRQTVPARSAAFQIDETNNLHLTVSFPMVPSGTAVLRSELIARLPRGHRQFVQVTGARGAALAESLLDAAHHELTLPSAGVAAAGSSPAPRAAFLGFLGLGIEHILTGYDHLLFLFALLVMVPGWRDAALLITCFTVAHSITLAVATFDWVNLDRRYVEPLIAASIVYVGVENLLRHDGPRGRWRLTLLFGLIHGFGFASVLRDMGVASADAGVALPLFSFNLGVELGQIAIAAVAVPIILRLRVHPAVVRRWVPACSLAVISAGAWWLVQRTFP